MSRAAAQPVGGDLPAQRVAVHAEQVGGAAEVAVGFGENVRDVALFKFPLRVVEADATVHHVVDEALELLAERRHSSSFPESRRNASTYFSRVRAMTSSGRVGTGGCLFHRICSR